MADYQNYERCSRRGPYRIHAIAIALGRSPELDGTILLLQTLVSGCGWIKLRMSWQLLPCLPASIVLECAMYTDKGEDPNCSYLAVALSCYNNQSAKHTVLPGTILA